MVAVDTNIVVRLLTGDDPEQFQRGKGLFEREQVFIPATVILETEWVLRYAYKFPPAEIASAVTVVRKALISTSSAGARIARTGRTGKGVWCWCCFPARRDFRASRGSELGLHAQAA